MNKNKRKTIILDTNIIIKDPNSITRWTPMVDIIVPDIVVRELFSLSNHGRISKNLIHLWEESGYKQFIKEVEIDNLVIDRRKVSSPNTLSRTDLLLAQYTQSLSGKSGSDVYLATEDRKLEEYCQSIGVKTLRISDFSRIVSEYVTTDLSETNESIGSEQKKLIRFWVVSFLILLICTGITLYFQDKIIKYIINSFLPMLHKNYKVIIPSSLPVIGILLYWFRSLQRGLYGLVETGVGTVGAMYIFSINDNQNNINSLTVISIIGSLYVIVRGLDNFYQGIKGSKLEPYVRKFLMEKQKK
ncbi:PIN domain-containing protein [Paenibacillus wynnii]|uniref:PIN domain-containing protein n=1 Tax=Paenibacillus wynnii TaxID=268407 RepID=UPI00279264B3|nr:PIN domain-containing protein [Paenibacillus wynnii]MDQ0194588.1 rRNA-processing protein FCF1 [Paenibacillus wynnii]